MTTDVYDGDVALFLTPDGGNIDYRSGQPQMDPGGLETAVNISLFTRNGWPGNFLDSSEPSRQIGSRFEESVKSKPITAQILRDINQAGQDALQWLIDVRAATSVTVNATSPLLNRIDVDIKIVRIEGVTVNIFYELNWIAGVLHPITASIL